MIIAWNCWSFVGVNLYQMLRSRLRIGARTFSTSESMQHCTPGDNFTGLASSIQVNNWGNCSVSLFLILNPFIRVSSRWCFLLHLNMLVLIRHVRCFNTFEDPTPYSMNRLFSESFRKFGGAFLEVCETISRGIWQVLRGKMKEHYPEKIRNKSENSY